MNKLIALLKVPYNLVIRKSSIGIYHDDVLTNVACRGISTVADIVLMIILNGYEAYNVDVVRKPRKLGSTLLYLDSGEHLCYLLLVVSSCLCGRGKQKDRIAFLLVYFGAGIVYIEGRAVPINVGLNGYAGRELVNIIGCGGTVAHYLLSALVGKHVRVIDRLSIVGDTVTLRAELRVIDNVYRISFLKALADGYVAYLIEYDRIRKMSECLVGCILISAFNDEVAVRINVCAEACITRIFCVSDNECLLSFLKVLGLYVIKPISNGNT